MDEGSGNITYNYSGYNNNGTFYGQITTLANSTVLQLTGSITSLEHKISIPYYPKLIQAIVID